MIDSTVRQEILNRLKAAEREHNVKILLAIESGSRAWGFASPNSDYDVRFIYVHPKDWYLSVDLEDRRDVIEYEIVDDIDLNGWELRKALKLFWKSNPAFVEWVQSPITYLERGDFASTVRDLLPAIYSPEKGIHHYRSMAKTNYRGYLKGDLVPLKKYFYVLRPLLAVRWLERHSEAAPIEFDRLLPLLEDPAVLEDIHALLERKKVALEKEMAPPVERLNQFIELELERLEGYKSQYSDRSVEMDQLNTLFQQILGEDPHLSSIPC
ncbi:hypothetical protein SAMN04487965_2957 [Microbulbifer donghaiensis]|uniref:Nucleotidyltransferase n=1 Tax=Microbulbifer donghaiensis TaxID=494016 RepID=A0A1M5FKS4_9GAMM|nr:nucleotidyltransferase domain-containing protein [Microbulbifer donghaiensis]SHF92108.1 hypothetical protein SAMN04487965_2957 [Microbulbifer donghaiensis]